MNGWGSSGGGLRQAPYGRLIVGSGAVEVEETLESLRASGNNNTATLNSNYMVVPKNVNILPILKY